MNNKILKKGKVVSFKKLFNSLSDKDQQKVLKGSTQIRLAMVLRKLRKKHQLTQQKLADKMKVKREYIAQIESGNYNATIQTLSRIASATNTKFSFYFK